MERGTIQPLLKRLEQFADIFDCTLTDLLTQSSRRIDEQTTYIQGLLVGLDDEDRALVIRIIEKLSHRLRQS